MEHEWLPAKTVTCFVECAGNGRSYYSSQEGTMAGGSQWHLGGIGVASWTGALTLATAGGCSGPNDATCDNYRLTVQPPSYGFSAKIVPIRQKLTAFAQITGWLPSATP